MADMLTPHHPDLNSRPKTYDVLIVGAGHAGAQAALSLRQLGFNGTIAIIGDEPHLPYERPSLSKDYLAGLKRFDRMLIRPHSFWKEREIDIILGQKVTAVDPDARQVTVGSCTFGYGKLIWAAGGSARRLTCHGHDAQNVHVVRNRNDVDAVIASLDQINHVTIIGGGYIGLETAATLRKSGKAVVLLEAQDRVLARVAGEDISRFFETEHRSHGVDLRTNTAVAQLETSGTTATAVLLSDGERIETDMVIVGIGITPATLPLSQAGAQGKNGVDVDSYCRTSLEDIYAIGDCAAHINHFAQGARIRLESVQNANDQAKTVAGHIMGQTDAYHALPWFWSNQYELKLQTVGISTGHDEAVLRGEPTSRSFTTIYLNAGRVVALDCVNAMKDFTQGKALVSSQALIDPATLSDSTLALKDMVPQIGISVS